MWAAGLGLGITVSCVTCALDGIVSSAIVFDDGIAELRCHIRSVPAASVWDCTAIGFAPPAGTRVQHLCGASLVSAGTWQCWFGAPGDEGVPAGVAWHVPAP